MRKIKPPVWGLFATILLIFLTAGAVLPSFGVEETPDMSHAKAVYLYNVELGRVMAEKNPKESIYPASTVKIMTGLVAIEELGSRISQNVTVTEEMLKGVSGNNIKLKAGETVNLTDMLYATLCGGANDSAAVLAYASCGSMEAFVSEMNEKAKLLGAIDTNYTNVSGMHDPLMVTTAYDTFLVSKAASENGLFTEITSQSKYVMPATNLSEERNIYNKNYLISRYSETKYYNKYAKGLNSGSTSQGGYCLAACTENDGQTYICVVMGADEYEGNISSYTVANALLDWAYGSYGYVTVLSTDRLVCEIPVTLSEDVDYVTLRPANNLSVFMPLSVDTEKELVYTHKLTSSSLEAPVEEGQVAGFISVEYNGELLGNVDLVTMNRVGRSEFLYTLKHLRDFSHSRVFIVSVISFALLFTVYILGTAMYRGKSGRHRRHYR